MSTVDSICVMVILLFSVFYVVFEFAFLTYVNPDDIGPSNHSSVDHRLKNAMLVQKRHRKLNIKITRYKLN